MRQFITIAVNAFMELVRQPVFLLLQTSTAVFTAFLATPYYFAFGDEPNLVKNSTLALMLLSGMLGAVLSATSSLGREVRSGTALAVLSKPVGRAQFLLAKYAGLALALTVMMYVNLVATLLASRMAFDAYGEPDRLALTVFFLGLLVAYLIGGFSNYFLRRPFVSDAFFAQVVMVTLAFIILNFYDRHGDAQEWAKGVDWRMLPAGLLIVLAVYVLAGLALACSTRLDVIPTLVVCSAFFLLGIMSDYLFGRAAQAGSWWASVLYAMTPNWQLFWIADAVETGRNTFHWNYFGKAAGYTVAYVVAILAVAVALFEDRELS
jgi:ABC-type transport system involved in multi-copper enzyme maturation permease subunit